MYTFFFPEGDLVRVWGDLVRGLERFGEGFGAIWWVWGDLVRGLERFGEGFGKFVRVYYCLI